MKEYKNAVDPAKWAGAVFLYSFFVWEMINHKYFT